MTRPITADEAFAIVNGLIFAVQKTRSDLIEGLGDDDVAEVMLVDMQPFLFGETPVLPKLLEWQTQVEREGVVLGSDLYNWVTLFTLKEPLVLTLLPLYGYPDVIELKDPTWFAQQWRKS